MNILPTHPKYAGERYFRDMDRLHADVAYTAYYAQTKAEVLGPLFALYKKFVDMAHERGMPACIQIQSTLANLTDLGLAEAQHSVDNIPLTFQAGNVGGSTVCFASFASEAWKKLLQELTDIFVQKMGFDWVVFEEPMFAVDIPGTKDRFYEVFRRAHPGSNYPARHEESPAYLKVQWLKKKVLTDFYAALLDHAKAAGAKQAGIMPWFFTPIYENTPYETLDTSCDLGRIIHLPSLDFVVVRMQPDNIYSGATDLVPSQVGARLYYTEVMAHSLGKPVICVNNAVNEHRDWLSFDAIPLDYFRAATLSALAAAPEGMSHHWYVPRDLPHIEPHWEFLAKVTDALRRLGGPQTPLAFVYSYRGTTHSWPYRNPQLFERFWGFAQAMLFEPGQPYAVGDRTIRSGNIPFKVFYAETLAQSIEKNPDVRLLVLDEYYPLSSAETQLLRFWLESASPEQPRAALVFASGYGYSADPEITGDAELNRAWPEMLDLCGFDAAKPARPLTINRCRTVRRRANPFSRPTWGEEYPAYIFRNLAAELKPGTEVLYENEMEKRPYLTHAKLGAAGSVFTLCAGLWPRTLPPLTPLVRNILKLIQAPLLEVEPGPGILWNLSKNGYVIAANPMDAESYVDLPETAARYWDAASRKFIITTRVPLAPFSFILLRRLLDGQRVLDVEDASIVSMDDPPGGKESRVVIEMRGRALLRLLETPYHVHVLGEDPRASQVAVSDYMDNESPTARILSAPGRKTILIEWSE